MMILFFQIDRVLPLIVSVTLVCCWMKSSGIMFVHTQYILVKVLIGSAFNKPLLSEEEKNQFRNGKVPGDG